MDGKTHSSHMFSFIECDESLLRGFYLLLMWTLEFSLDIQPPLLEIVMLFFIHRQKYFYFYEILIF